MKNAKILVESLNQVFLNALMIMLGAHKHLQGLGQLPLVRYRLVHGTGVIIVYQAALKHLAKGAVIPPRSEFLAVLGDQKQGNNIETPEALLRKIVREETAGRQAGGGSYRFTAQINRRTLFDEMMKEAQMRRDTSGRNPFEMA